MSAAEPRGNARELTLATIAFALCFYAWALLGPLGPDLQDQLGLSDSQLALTISIPVVLGSLMRIPLGILTDRYGGRRVFTALMAFTPLPLVGLALFNDSWAAVLVFGFLLGFAGASFAVGVPFVNKWYPAERQGFALGHLRDRDGRHRAGRADRAADRRRDEPRRPVLDRRRPGRGDGRGLLARWRRTPRARLRGEPARSSRPLAVFRGKGAGRAWALTLFYFMAFGGFVAMFLYLPKLLVDVHDLSKTDAGARAAGFALLAVIARPLGGWLSDRIGARERAHGLVRRHRRPRARARRPLRAHGAADDRLPDHGGLPRPRHRRRVQARARVVPRPRRRGHRRRRRRGRPRRLLPAAGDGAR